MFDRAENAPVPNALVAATRKLVGNPVGQTVDRRGGGGLVGHRARDGGATSVGTASTVKPVSTPAGAVKFTVAEALVAVAAPMTGAAGGATVTRHQ